MYQDKLEPIAIVGFALKFPQDATSSESFWSMMEEGRCAATAFPANRFNADAFYHPDNSRNDAFSVRGGHFLKEDLAAFDADFFSISPAEASAMDPMQRGILETTYKAFENAGIPITDVAGSQTSVYTGCFTDDYMLQIQKDPELLPKYGATGIAKCLLANRISWFYNLVGPSMNLDSACSSSGLALDIACQGLRAGDCTMSVVAGCNLTYDPAYTTMLTNLSMLSPDGRCFSFDKRGNGYARGEGFGVVILKPLSRAIHDGDMIRAVVRATGVNQDGYTPGITQPSKEAQERLIIETYRKSGLSMIPTRFFEAHGTGTAVGDPIEANALGSAFRGSRSSEDPLYVGAVKSNIGHLEGASGIAGLIKAVLVLEKGVIPPNTNFQSVNRKIDTQYLNIKFPVEPTPWPDMGLRRASINSFGFGGTNSHIILDDAFNFLRLRGLPGKHQTVQCPPSVKKVQGDLPVQVNGNGTKTADAPKLLVWSAADQMGLSRLANAYSRHFTATPASDPDVLANLAYTLDTRRSILPWRSYSVAGSLNDIRQLETKISKPIQANATAPRLAFIFTGQGAQWFAMGRELLAYSVFRDSLNAADTYLDEFLKSKKDSNINDPQYSQTLCTVLQVALVELLRGFNITASAVVGHSSGEIAAAYCSGALSREEAWRIAYFRGIVSASVSRTSSFRGAMMAVGLSEEKIKPYLDRVAVQFGRLDLVIACVNSSKNITISGLESQIDELLLKLSGQSIFARKLQVTVAYHSPQMEQVATEYSMLIGKLKGPETPCGDTMMVSSITGHLTPGKALRQSSYWVKNLISPVRFSDAVQRLCFSRKLTKKLDGSHRTTIFINNIIEVGPHAALQGPTRQVLESMNRTEAIEYSSLLTRNTSASVTVMELVGHLQCLGFPVDLRNVNESVSRRSRTLLTDLPEYPFNHSHRHWFESRLSRNFKFKAHGRMDLLGTPVPDWNPLDAKWRNILRLSEMPWMEDHKINDVILYPGAGMLVMALEAARQMADRSKRITGYILRDVAFRSALEISSDRAGTETQFSLRPSKGDISGVSNWYDFSVCLCADDTWSENCRGSIQVEYEKPSDEVYGSTETMERLDEMRQSYNRGRDICPKSVDPKAMYQYLQDRGFGYGPSFRAIQSLQCGEQKSAVADIQIYKESDDSSALVQPYIIHPITLDAVAHLMFAAVTNGGTREMPTNVPTRIDKLWLSSSGLCSVEALSLDVLATALSQSHRTIKGSVLAFSKDSRDLRIVIEGMETTAITSVEVSTKGFPEANQVYCTVSSKPDIDMLNTHQALAYLLEETSGSHIGKSNLCHDVTGIMEGFLRQALFEVDSAELVPSKLCLRNCIACIKLQLQQIDSSAPFQAKKKTDVQFDPLTYASSQAEDFGAEERLIVEFARHLPEILTEKIELPQLNALVEGYHYGMVLSSIAYQRFAAYLDLLAYKNPRMNILEIGGPTGWMTRFTLQVLLSRDSETLRCNQYTRTNTSVKFFDTPRAKGSKVDRKINYRTLDIGTDPLTQGFEEETYDLVIIGGGLCSDTSYLDCMMQHVRKLLKADGKLVLHEPIRKLETVTYSSSNSLPDWWMDVLHFSTSLCFSDQRSTECYRDRNACISEADWDGLLSRHGLEGPQLTFQDDQHQTSHGSTIVISTPKSLLGQSTPTLNTVIVIEEGSPFQRTVAQRLRGLLESEHYSACSIVSLGEARDLQSSTTNFYIFLIEIERPLLDRLDESTYTILQSILLSVKNVLWVSSGGGKQQMDPGFGIIQGLARSLRVELINLVWAILALGRCEAAAEYPVETVVQVMRSTVLGSKNGTYEREYVQTNGILNINRIVQAPSLKSSILRALSPQQAEPMKIQEAPPLRLTIASPGQLETLQFLENAGLPEELEADEADIDVRAVGLNLADYFVAMGRAQTDSLGTECAGIVRRAGTKSRLQAGDRICMYAIGSFKSRIRVKADLVAKIPDCLSFEDAAGLVTASLTAFYALHEVARIEQGNTVLIHSGGGMIGQAAIRISQAADADIYATVHTKEEKQLLRNIFNIPESRILSSTSFTDRFKRLSHGRGADVVLNISDQGISESWECLGPFGHFIDIGQEGRSDQDLAMTRRPENVGFSTVDLRSVCQYRPLLIQKALSGVMELVKKNQLQAAQPLYTFSVPETEAAFRRCHEVKDNGKVVVVLNKEDEVMTVTNIRPSYQLDPTMTYVIAGGLGGIGRSFARLLASRGARYLVLPSRSGPNTAEKQRMLQELKMQGVCIRTPSCDIADRVSLESALLGCSDMPPIKGCIHVSGVLRDLIFEKMAFTDWREATEPKVQGSWNLHSLLPNGMDFFIMTASIAGILGHISQSNYAAANTYQDSLARFRVSQGEKATAIDFGIIAEDGSLAENSELRQRLMNRGFYIPTSHKELLAIVEHYCDPSLAVLSPEDSQPIIGIDLPSNVLARGLDLPDYMRNPAWHHMYQVESSVTNSPAATEQALDVAAMLAGAETTTDAGSIITQALVKWVANTIAIPEHRLDVNKPIHTYGVDSLTAVDMRSWFMRTLDVEVVVFDILGGTTFTAMGLLVARKLKQRDIAKQEGK
ncbi:hypothetical protein MMC30_002638 [Trapelia coarctata]|nr:hypothetical protein [Trapelia coarctata]